MNRMCEYCENLNDGRGAEIIYDDKWTDRYNLYKDNEGKYRIECYADHSSPINYCPMCGRNLKEEKMKTLTLSLKKQWFDMIKSGEKKEEYREIKPFWEKRLLDYKAIKADAQTLAFKRYVLNIPYDVCKDYPRGYDRLVFTLGYPKAGDTERRLTFKNPKIRIGTGRPEWGAVQGKQYFVITWEE